MATMLLPPDFKEFLQLLNDHDAEYLLIGGYAVGYYGYPRTTGDMDIFIAHGSPNAERILAVLKAFGFGESAGLSVDLFLKPGEVVRMGNPPLRLELLTGISGVAFADCYDRRVIAELDGISVSIISLDDLKTNKAASGRLKDLNDLQHLP